MGMSTHVVAFRPPDSKWERMRAAYEACTAAGIRPPAQVEKYFEGLPPDPNGVLIDEDMLVNAGALRSWEGDAAQGWEIDTAKLPEDVTVVRFYNSW